MKKSFIFLIVILLAVILSGLRDADSWTPIQVDNDPLLRMPGTQPGSVTLEGANRCLNCHSGYNTSLEPGFNWMGSMMAQAARDFIFWACLTVAGQDSIWAVGTPNAVDICERCHFPNGWLEGRSDPPNASAMTGSDFDGVQCDFCHRMWDPFFQDTFTGQREGSDWVNFWDETGASQTPSQPAADFTYVEDSDTAKFILLFNGTRFFGPDNRPVSLRYTENVSGQFFVSPNSAKRASFADAVARHRMYYSRHHKSKYFCATCHDVSNPVLANLGQDGSTPLTTETDSANSFYHVERTFSEFMLSDYGRQGGTQGIGPFAPTEFYTSNPSNSINKCQDCHMRDLAGKGCDKPDAPLRPYDSVEHPRSGQPMHDLTGGNAFVSYVLASAIEGSPNYDPTNASLLNQGPDVLTLDIRAGVGIDPVALLAGAERAKQQLMLAASITDLSYDPEAGSLGFRVQNQTGHKLISGFPEGRRMFVNVKAYSGGNIIYEINPYDQAVATLSGLPASYSPNSPGLSAGEVHIDELVYETHPTSSLTGEQETFHFALATGRYKDNRIPPKGFRISEASARHSEPVWHGVPAPDYFSAEEYAGGFDDILLDIPPGADRVEVSLYYQTTSREYMEFLRDEINGTAASLKGTGKAGDAPYLIQSDPFFAGLKAWGDTVWQLWEHNRAVPGAAPILMSQAVLGGQAGCKAPTPTLESATASHQAVTLGWSSEHSGDGSVVGYNVYYDQSGKSQAVASLGLVTTYSDTGLTNGQQYCYKVTSRYSGCVSQPSNVLCATPSPGTATSAGVSTLETGYLTSTGKGKQTTVSFSPSSSFTAGDEVAFRAYVKDQAGNPVSGVVVEITVSGGQSAVLASSASDQDGVALAVWQTSSPRMHGKGGTVPGSYTASVTNIVSDAYSWDGFMAEVSFVLN